MEQYGYFRLKTINGIFTHQEDNISFTLVVDDFGIKYNNKDDILKLINILQAKYTITQEWSEKAYLGMKLNWDYKEKTLDISMPGYVEESLRLFNQQVPDNKQDYPHPIQPIHCEKK